MKKEWRRVPPAALSLAVLIRHKPPPEKGEEPDIVPGEELAAMFGTGPIKAPGDG